MTSASTHIAPSLLQLLAPQSPHIIEPLDVFTTYCNSSDINNIYWNLDEYMGSASPLLIKDERLEIQQPVPFTLPYVTENTQDNFTYNTILLERGIYFATVFAARIINGPTLTQYLNSLKVDDIPLIRIKTRQTLCSNG